MNRLYDYHYPVIYLGRCKEYANIRYNWKHYFKSVFFCDIFKTYFPFFLRNFLFVKIFVPSFPKNVFVKIFCPFFRQNFLPLFFKIFCPFCSKLFFLFSSKFSYRQNIRLYFLSIFRQKIFSGKFSFFTILKI